jgi:hypothetical protein
MPFCALVLLQDIHMTDIYSRYFLNIHPIFPIVNKHTFLLRYRGQSKTYPSTIVFNAMLGAAARYFEISTDTSMQTTKDNRALSDVLFERVLKEVFLQSASGPSLPMVQAIILLIKTEKQTRKRIWWSLYIMDRFNSALFGKPLTIVDEVRQTCLIKVHISDAVTNFSCD